MQKYCKFCLLVICSVFLLQACGHKASVKETSKMPVGSFNAKSLKAVVQQHSVEIKTCYELGLKQHPTMSGKVVIKWTVIDGGYVSDVSIKSSQLGVLEVENCMVNKIKTWRFPQPPDGQPSDISYPFIFQARD